MNSTAEEYIEVINTLPNTEMDNISTTETSILEGGNIKDYHKELTNEKSETETATEKETETETATETEKETETATETETETETATETATETEKETETEISVLEGGDIKDYHKELTDKKDVMFGGSSISTQYKINYLVAEDEKIINLDRVNTTITRYLDNIKSETNRKYKQQFKSIYQKYSNKKFKIDNNEDYIIVSRIDKKKEIIAELEKPKYIFYNKFNNLLHMKTIISNNRSELLSDYQNLVSKLEVSTEEKHEFEKRRKSFIDILERYYIYTTYHKYINDINTIEKSSIIIQEMRNITKENGDEQYFLEGEIYEIDNNIINSINENNSEKLNTYNDLIAKLQGINFQQKNKSKDSTKDINRNEIVNTIKAYLDKTSINKLNDDIKNVKKMQDSYIDFIIIKLPSKFLS